MVSVEYPDHQEILASLFVRAGSMDESLKNVGGASILLDVMLNSNEV